MSCLAVCNICNKPIMPNDHKIGYHHFKCIEMTLLRCGYVINKKPLTRQNIYDIYKIVPRDLLMRKCNVKCTYLPHVKLYMFSKGKGFTNAELRECAIYPEYYEESYGTFYYLNEHELLLLLSLIEHKRVKSSAK